MSIPYSKREKLAGLFLLLGLGFIFVSAILVGGGRDWFRTYNNYYALYNEGYGILPGAKVSFLRTDVGRVTKLELTGNNKVKIHMAILKEYASRITSDSQAAVESPTLIGSEYISIIPGDTASPLVPAGGQIPARERKNVDDVLKELRLEEKLRQFEDIMTNVASLTNQLQDPGGPLLGTMSNVRKMTGAVADGQGSLGRVVADDELYREIYKITQTLATASADLAQTTDQVKILIPEILKKIEAISAKLEVAARSAPDISRGAREGLREVNQVLDSAKKNILIRGNLSQDPAPDSLNYPARRE